MLRKTVNLDEGIVKELKIYAKKESRDFSSALRHALRVGLLALQNPELTTGEIIDILEAKAELEEGMVEELTVEDI